MENKKKVQESGKTNNDTEEDVLPPMHIETVIFENCSKVGGEK